MNYRMDCTCKLAELMRDIVPLAPGYEFDRMVIVEMHDGDRIGAHQHTEHTALYYPMAAAPIKVTPVPGMMIYLPPGCQHSVPDTTERRLSVAMLVEPVEQ